MTSHADITTVAVVAVHTPNMGRDARLKGPYPLKRIFSIIHAGASFIFSSRWRAFTA